MNGLFEKASLEIYFENGTAMPTKQTYANLKEGVEPAVLNSIRSAISTVSSDPVGDLVVVNRTRYLATGEGV